jgi:hypothetical protein
MQARVVESGAPHEKGREHTPMQLQVAFFSHAGGVDTQ